MDPIQTHAVFSPMELYRQTYRVIQMTSIVKGLAFVVTPTKHAYLAVSVFLSGTTPRHTIAAAAQTKIGIQPLAPLSVYMINLKVVAGSLVAVVPINGAA